MMVGWGGDSQNVYIVYAWTLTSSVFWVCQKSTQHSNKKSNIFLDISSEKAKHTSKLDPSINVQQNRCAKPTGNGFSNVIVKSKSPTDRIPEVLRLKTSIAAACQQQHRWF